MLDAHRAVATAREHAPVQVDELRLDARERQLGRAAVAEPVCAQRNSGYLFGAIPTELDLERKRATIVRELQRDAVSRRLFFSSPRNTYPIRETKVGWTGNVRDLGYESQAEKRE